MWRRKPKGTVKEGAPAPAFQLTSLDGGQRTLSEILQNGPALLVFYKISCPVCQLTVPFLQRLSAGGTLQVVGISQDDNSSTQSFNQRFGITFPTLLDQSKEGYPASNSFGISSVPSLFLVEQDATVAQAFQGFSKRDIQALGERAGTQIFRSEDNVPEWKAG
jgi:peroxiredoxin